MWVIGLRLMPSRTIFSRVLYFASCSLAHAASSLEQWQPVLYACIRWLHMSVFSYLHSREASNIWLSLSKLIRYVVDTFMYNMLYDDSLSGMAVTQKQRWRSSRLPVLVFKGQISVHRPFVRTWKTALQTCCGARACRAAVLAQVALVYWRFDQGQTSSCAKLT